MTDEVKCPHCGEISNIGGLIGPNTNDCPKCGKAVLHPVAPNVNFKVYRRKIHVYELREGQWVYCWSTNAARTCRDAVASAATRYPHKAFKANFAKE